VSPLVGSLASASFPRCPKRTPPPPRLVEACPPAISRTSPGARRASSVAGSPRPSRRSRARPTEAVASPRGRHRTASEAHAIASAWASCAPSPGVTAMAGVDRTCPPWTSERPTWSSSARSASACPRRTRSTTASRPTAPPRPANAHASGQPPPSARGTGGRASVDVARGVGGINGRFPFGNNRDVPSPSAKRTICLRVISERASWRRHTAHRGGAR